ncbi:MAG TPA: hypothetical protein VH640_11330 [Bryobacteraceae bacterium]
MDNPLMVTLAVHTKLRFAITLSVKLAVDVRPAYWTNAKDTSCAT